FDAIINPPQAAILSVGTISKQPVVNDAGEIVPGQVMFIGLSCDHRVIDGAVGAQYLAELKRLIQTPVLLVA
ncbi:MAG: 2-oxo acid dehydrogenase subunit E2, partial [Verrucomicrobiota bacterium]